MRAPNRRTIHARGGALDTKLVARKRHDVTALADLQAVPGELVAPRPLGIVQIDHTPVDVMVVDAETPPLLSADSCSEPGGWYLDRSGRIIAANLRPAPPSFSAFVQRHVRLVASRTLWCSVTVRFELQESYNKGGCG